MRSIIGAAVLAALVTIPAFGGEPDSLLARMRPDIGRSTTDTHADLEAPRVGSRIEERGVRDVTRERLELESDVAAIVPSLGHTAELDSRTSVPFIERAPVAPRDRRRVDRESEARGSGGLDARGLTSEIADLLDRDVSTDSDLVAALFTESDDGASGRPSPASSLGFDVAVVALPLAWTGIVVGATGLDDGFGPAAAKDGVATDSRAFDLSFDDEPRFTLPSLAGLRFGEHYQSVRAIPDFETRRVEWGVRAGFLLVPEATSLGGWSVDVRLHARVAGDSAAEIHSTSAREWITTIGITSGR